MEFLLPVLHILSIHLRVVDSSSVLLARIPLLNNVAIIFALCRFTEKDERQPTVAHFMTSSYLCAICTQWSPFGKHLYDELLARATLFFWPHMSYDWGLWTPHVMLHTWTIRSELHFNDFKLNKRLSWEEIRKSIKDVAVILRTWFQKACKVGSKKLEYKISLGIAEDRQTWLQKIMEDRQGP